MSSAQVMFGVASSTAYFRCGGSGINTRYVLASLASGFGGTTGDGAYVHDLFAAKTGFFIQSGFENNSPYVSLLENRVPYLAGYLKIGVGAIIYSYANLSNVSKNGVLKIINTFQNTLTGFIGGTTRTFKESDLDLVIDELSIDNLNAETASIFPSGNTGKAVNYNWYDAAPLFGNPDIEGLGQLIKDSENQYYYISGELLYQEQQSSLPICIEYQRTVTTPTGDLTFDVIANAPCHSKSSYVGPISGIKFFRIFNDGPGSSGNFDAETMEAYKAWDKTFMDPKDYSSNAPIIYSDTRNSSGWYVLLKNGVPIDIPGWYDSINEWGANHTNVIVDECGINNWPMQRMHQGDNRPKLSFVATRKENGDCNPTGGSYYDWTGWKLVPFELKNELAWKYSNFVMNPALDTGRIIKRVLSLDNYIDANGPVTPYANVIDDGDGVLRCTGIVGPPQLNGNLPMLPGFVFYQTFDNPTFGDYASVTVRAALLSGGTYKVSDYDLFTASGNSHFPVYGPGAKVPFTAKICSTGLSVMDEVTKKCLGMGDYFGGSNLVASSSPQYNAGYSYAGYSYTMNGQPVSEGTLLSIGTEKIGSQYSTIRYVTGFTGIGEYPVKKKYAYIVNPTTLDPINYAGQLIMYSYFDDGILGAINTGWTGNFAPIPPVVESDPDNYMPVYGEQPVENYIPRFCKGPYSTYQSKFLYPNAQNAYSQFRAESQGFPRKLNYEIVAQEECVREIIGYQDQYGDVLYCNAIRALPERLNEYGRMVKRSGEMKTSMSKPFATDNGTYNFIYSLDNNELYTGDFENFFSPALVDEDYAPSADYSCDPKVNSTFHGEPIFENNNFKQGIKLLSGMKYRDVYTGINQINRSPLLMAFPLPQGLYWGYKVTGWSGSLDYVLPVFHLDTEQVVIDSGLKAKFDAITDWDKWVYQPGMYQSVPYSQQCASFNGEVVLDGKDTFSGQEFLGFDFVGGRIGPGAEIEGGNNRLGIIGDAWYDATGCTWGAEGVWSPEPWKTNTKHSSERDDHLFILAWKPDGLDIYAKALRYAPYYLDNTYTPFSTFPGSMSNLNWRKINDSGEYGGFLFELDLNEYFGLRNITEPDLYNTEGLTLGPFNRDVELCVTSGHGFGVSGYLLANGQMITSPIPVKNDPYGPITPGKMQFDLWGIAPTSGIWPGRYGGEWGYTETRSPNVTTFKLIPAGSTCNINFSGDGNGVIGLTGKSIITVRPRVADGNLLHKYYSNFSERWEYCNEFGDGSCLNTWRYIKNNTETKFSLLGNIQDLLVPKDIIMKTEDRVLYPVPEGDFDDIVKPGVDAFGNPTYPPHPTKLYWQIKNPTGRFPKIRESIRIRFLIKKLSVAEVGPIPYQSQNSIVPFGDCIVSGEFGYTGQCESAIVSEGIYLSGQSGASSLSEIFAPAYVSEVMQRLPSGFYTLPSGSGWKPILPAPSKMQIRKDAFHLTGHDRWIPVAPTPQSHYNAFLWPAWSDLGLLNPELVYEAMPPDDGNVFLDSYLTFSAAQGQKVGTGKNPSENVIYVVRANFGFVDSTSTNSYYNTGTNIFSGYAIKTSLHSGDLSGILTTEGSSLTMTLNLGNYRK